MQLLCSNNFIIFSDIHFSMILEIMGSRETGLQFWGNSRTHYLKMGVTRAFLRPAGKLLALIQRCINLVTGIVDFTNPTYHKNKYNIYSCVPGILIFHSIYDISFTWLNINASEKNIIFALHQYEGNVLLDQNKIKKAKTH